MGRGAVTPRRSPAARRNGARRVRRPSSIDSMRASKTSLPQDRPTTFLNASVVSPSTVSTPVVRCRIPWRLRHSRAASTRSRAASGSIRPCSPAAANTETGSPARISGTPRRVREFAGIGLRTRHREGRRVFARSSPRRRPGRGGDARAFRRCREQAPRPPAGASAQRAFPRRNAAPARLRRRRLARASTPDPPRSGFASAGGARRRRASRRGGRHCRRGANASRCARGRPRRSTRRRRQ